MRPLSPQTAALFRPLDISKLDRLQLTISETGDKFTADFWSGREELYHVSERQPTELIDYMPHRMAAFRKINRRAELPHMLAKYRFNDTTKYTPSSEALKFIARIPERKQLTKQRNSPCAYELGATDITVDLIAALWPKEQLSFFDELTEVTFGNILQRSNMADYCAEVVARFKRDGELPSHWLEQSAEFPLSPYQQIAAYCAYLSPGYALFMEQGTGKTPTAISVLCNKIAEEIENANGKFFKAIVVTPKSVRKNWESELAKFTTRSGRITVLRGLDINRVRQMIDATAPPQDGEEFSIVICGYETLTKSWEAIGMPQWDCAILDESQMIKSNKTKRYETSCKLRDRSAKRIVLTGTPIANSIMDIYTQLEFLGKGYSGFTSFKEFKKFYGVYDGGEGGTSLVGYQNLPFMQERLARYSYFISKAEALPNLPEKVFDQYEIEMTAQQQEAYQSIKDKLYWECEAELNNSGQPKEVVINNILVKLLKLAQVTSGFVSFNEIRNDEGLLLAPRSWEYFYPNPKIDGLLDLIWDKKPEQKTQIWACFKPDIQYIEHALKEHGFDCVSFYGGTSDEKRAEAEYRFNCDRNCRFFIGNPAAGGTGLNLLGYEPGKPELYDTNCDHVIYYSQNWSRLARAQSEDRTHRRGTRVQVRYTDLVVPNTIDEEIRMRVIEKHMMAYEISDIRKILANVFNNDLMAA